MDSESRKEIVDVSLLIVNEQIGLVEGCRKLVSLRNQFALAEDQDFFPFVGVTSETDDYPEQSVRENFSDSYLKRVDKDVSCYVSIVRPSIIEACTVLVAKYK